MAVDIAWYESSIRYWTRYQDWTMVERAFYALGTALENA